MKKLLFALLMCQSTLSIAASFDCSKASTPNEKAICENPVLSKLDDQLASVYKSAMANAGAGSNDIKLAQREWIKSNKQCNDNPAKMVACLTTSYESRIATLSKPTSAAPVTAAPVTAAPVAAAPVAAAPSPVAINSVTSKSVAASTPAAAPAAPSSQPRSNNQQQNKWEKTLQIAYDYRNTDVSIQAAFNSCITDITKSILDDTKKQMASAEKASTVSERNKIIESTKFIQDNVAGYSKGYCTYRLLVGVGRAGRGNMQKFQLSSSDADELVNEFLIKNQLLPRANKIIADTLNMSEKKFSADRLVEYKKLFKDQAYLVISSDSADILNNYSPPFVLNRIH